MKDDKTMENSLMELGWREWKQIETPEIYCDLSLKHVLVRQLSMVVMFLYIFLKRYQLNCLPNFKEKAAFWDEIMSSSRKKHVFLEDWRIKPVFLEQRPSKFTTRTIKVNVSLWDKGQAGLLFWGVEEPSSAQDVLLTFLRIYLWLYSGLTSDSPWGSLLVSFRDLVVTKE